MYVKTNADILGFFCIKYLNEIEILGLDMCLYMLVLTLHLT